MARKSNDQLIDQLSSCARDLLEIARDPEWSGQNDVIIRKAVPVFLRKVAESARWVVSLQFHVERYPFTGPRRALNVRAPQILLRTRWASDEAVFVLSGEVEDLLTTIRPILANDGLVASMGFCRFSGNLEFDVSHIDFAYSVKEKESQ